jgi:acyl-CoA ligase (AMP-forming) (exosortase A-associated)
MIETLPDLILHAAKRDGSAPALQFKQLTLDYDELLSEVRRFAAGAQSLGLKRRDRVAIYADKQLETVTAMFGTSLAGGVFVPVNGLLKAQQVAYILNDCSVNTLVTTAARLRQLEPILADCPQLKHIVVMDNDAPIQSELLQTCVGWSTLMAAAVFSKPQEVISTDIASIMYTSGSTGLPKGVVLSHANMVIGAISVAEYIENVASDRILAILPLSFDAGLSQLTTGFYAGACIVLHNYFLPGDVVRLVEREKITGITAVPPLWMQLTEQNWPDGSADTVRYFANTGGKMPRETLGQLRQIFSRADPFLMYGLTESFRSTYLPPSEVDNRPDSMGKAIPNVEVLVVAKDGSICAPGEVGELVHRGPLVSLGYWNDPERTAARFRPAPGQPDELPNAELAVWSGDSVKTDEDGFLYFVSRMDEMIKTSGYRVSPAEIEEIVYSTGLVAEVAALGIPHPRLAHAIVLVAKSKEAGQEPSEELLARMRPDIPNYMVPHAIHWKVSLPRNANGKIDRRALADEFAHLFQTEREQ